nr:D-aminopeptidase [Neomegalonema perideroedes]
MTKIDLSALEAALDALPSAYPGPGGAAGLLLEGAPLAARAWGYADLDARRPMTSETRLPICSISKQFTCMALLAAFPDPERLSGRLAALAPAFVGPRPSLAELCHNQSGLRDYWALTVLEGAKAEQPFRREDLAPMLAHLRSGHFAPGLRYSYCNLNYRLLADLLEAETGLPLEELYRRHVWAPAGMSGAVLTADTRRPEDRVTGYEGDAANGWIPAVNGVYWIGDAGISASLEDMLAYERWIDATREDPRGLYRRISEPVAFRDGTPAEYGYGLRRSAVAGLEATGHGGALRGFRCHRLNIRAARLSVVVMFNHQADAHGAAQRLARAALGEAEASPAAPISAEWVRSWIGAETGLIARISRHEGGGSLRFAVGAEPLREHEGALVSPLSRIEREGEGLILRRASENLTERLRPLPKAPPQDAGELAGRYVSADLGGAEMRIEARGGAAHVWFKGFLGEGRPEPLSFVAPDLWLISTRRSMDAPAPGDWTLQLSRDASGAVAGARVGCWLARGLRYDKRL